MNFCARAAHADGPPWAPPLRPVAEVLGRDYGIDASNVLSMNVDSVETVTGGIQSDTPDFAKMVKDEETWWPYAQRTYHSCFSTSDGYILSYIADPSKTSGGVPQQGYYKEVTDLSDIGDGGASKNYYLTKMERYLVAETGHPAGSFHRYDVKGFTIPTQQQKEDGTLLSASELMSKYGLSGAIYSYVQGGSSAGSRDDELGWYGTALINKAETEADNIDASFHLVQGGNLNEGFAFMVDYDNTVKDTITHNGKTFEVPRLTGYFLSMCSHNHKSVHTLFRIDNHLLDTPFGGQISCCAGNLPHMWYPGQSVELDGGKTTVTALASWQDDSVDIDYRIKADKGSIKVERTDNQESTFLVWNSAEGQQTNAQNVADAEANLAKEGITWNEGYAESITTSYTASDKQVHYPNKRGVTETVADIEITESEDGASTTYHDSVSGAKRTINKPNLSKGTYGFWGMNCEQGNQALVTDMNVKISKQVVKSFGNIVEEPAWTEGALHMLINIDSEADATMLVGAGRA